MYSYFIAISFVVATFTVEGFLPAAAFLQHSPAIVSHHTWTKGVNSYVIPNSQINPDALFWRKAAYSRNHLVFLPKSVQTQRKSVASIQTSLFGLGFGEIVVILLVLGAVLGPESVGRLVKTSGARAQELSEELKRVPEEFQKGMEEGEGDARARKAKRIKIVRDEEDLRDERDGK